MTSNVTVADYGVGNMFSICGALEYLGASVEMTDSPDRIASAERLLLPGVGAFADAMDDICNRNLVEPIQSFVSTGRPLLGICLGAQLLLSESEEFGSHPGLGLIPGRVLPVPNVALDGRPQRIPHVGWSDVRFRHPSPLLDGATDGTAFYFVHSFHAVPSDDRCCLAVCDYGGHEVTAIVSSDNVFGCQFHPEKSGPKGLDILRNYLIL